MPTPHKGSDALRNGNRNAKLQSAMEYLMTYGWAILIIAVIILALFQLGIFSASALSGNSCIAASGFLCQNPTLVTSGTLTFTFSQSSGSSFYNVQLACAATAQSTGLPNPITAFNSISATGAVLIPSSTGNTLTSGQSLTVASLPCYTSTGAQLSGAAIGSAYSGFIWVNYTAGGAPESLATNPWLTQKIATLKSKVV